MDNQIGLPESPKSMPGNGKPSASASSGANTHLDASSLESLKDHYEHDHDSLFNHAVSIVHSHEVADDIVQDSYTRTIAALQQGKEIEHLGAWLNRCVHNLSLQYVGKKKALPLREDLDLAGNESMQEITQRKHRFEEVMSAARKLSPDQKSTFVLAELKGMDYDEIAGSQDRGMEAVRQLLFRARRNIREAVGSDGFITAPILRPVKAFIKEGLVLRDQATAKLTNMEASVSTFLQNSAEAIFQPTLALVTGTAVIVVISTPTPFDGTDSPEPSDEIGATPVVVVAPTTPRPAPTPTESKDAPSSKKPVNREPRNVAPITAERPDSGVGDNPSTSPRAGNSAPPIATKDETETSETSDVVDLPSDNESGDPAEEVSEPGVVTGGGGSHGEGFGCVTDPNLCVDPDPPPEGGDPGEGSEPSQGGGGSAPIPPPSSGGSGGGGGGG